MDALQAYICAVQLDKGHSAAWTNLGNINLKSYLNFKLFMKQFVIRYII